MGESYTFEQSDASNWFHPLAFAVSSSDDSLSQLPTVPATYRVDGLDVTQEVYQRKFLFPKEQWMSHEYSVEVTITPEIAEAVAAEPNAALRYFCSHHRGLGLVGTLVIASDPSDPAAVADAVTKAQQSRPAPRETFDQECGTTGCEPYAHNASPDPCGGEVFLCGALASQLHRCFDSADCKMSAEMRTRVGASQTSIVTFMHQ